MPRTICHRAANRVRRFALFFLCLLVWSMPVAADEAIPAPEFSLADVYHAGDESAPLADYWVSEKYDGVRAYWDGRRLLSRGGNVFAAPVWFTAGLPAVALDGELWLGRGKFEETASIVRKQTPHDGWRRIRYLVFDLPEHGGVFRARYAAMQALVRESDNSYWQVVEQQPINSAAELKRRFDALIAAGGEGLMLRRIESLYHGKRNNDLLKYKPFADAEAVVIGYNPGKGKYAGMVGSLRVRTADGNEFNVGSGLSDEERKTPPPLGAVITYRFQGLTGNGLPRFPVFLRVRDDEPDM